MLNKFDFFLIMCTKCYVNSKPSIINETKNNITGYNKSEYNKHVVMLFSNFHSQVYLALDKVKSKSYVGLMFFSPIRYRSPKFSLSVDIT